MFSRFRSTPPTAHHPQVKNANAFILIRPVAGSAKLATITAQAELADGIILDGRAYIWRNYYARAASQKLDGMQFFRWLEQVGSLNLLLLTVLW